MRKKLSAVAVALLLSLSLFAAKAPKYVFLFIGDGMGLNQINMTEMYRASAQDQFGIDPLLFTTFPVASFATTFTYDRYITDSAASGTAIATGHKTEGGCVGLDQNGERLASIAEIAKRNGKKVAILTNDGVNEATPAAFYGHRPSRYDTDDLVDDLAASGFDFFAGAGIYDAKEAKIRHYSSLAEREAAVRNAGYTIVTSREEMAEKIDSAEKIVFLPKGKQGIRNRLYSLGMGQLEQRVCLKEMVKDAVEFMMKDKCREGFFLMAEGGQIDGQCHGNDARGVIEEVIDLDEAIAYAYEFYLKHPKETIIVVTADHETGNICKGGKTPAHYKILKSQKLPEGWISEQLGKTMLSDGNTPTWEETKGFLGEYLGLWKEVSVTEEEEAYLHHIYDVTIAKREPGSVKDSFDHTDNCIIANEATKMLGRKAGIMWGNNGHSSAFVPVFAIGKGSELFNSKLDNTDIFKNLLQIAHYK